MQHAAVMTALVPAYGGLLFEKRDTRVRAAPAQLERGRQSHDAAADNDNAPCTQARFTAANGAMQRRCRSSFASKVGQASCLPTHWSAEVCGWPQRAFRYLQGA